jgi:two-component system chemotaxis response regulator CheY
MEYHPHARFEYEHAISKSKMDAPSLWRCFHFEFQELPDGMDIEKLAQKIYNIFRSLPGSFYFDPRTRMSVFCKMDATIVVDDIIYKIKSLIKADFMCRLGEQSMIKDGVVALQFLFSPTSHEQQKLSQEFIAQERMNRQYDVVMVVEDDLFARNIATNALKGKFKVVEVADGGKAVQEYLSHSPDIVFLDIHLPNKKGYQILDEILELDPKAFVVMLSADAAKESVTQCVKSGAKGFVAKPFRGEKLFDYVRKCPTIRVYC